MAVRKQPASDNDTTPTTNTKPPVKASPGPGKPKGRTITVEPISLVIPTSAKAISEVLIEFSNQLQQVSGLLREKEKHDTIKLPIKLVLMCNSGGD